MRFGGRSITTLLASVATLAGVLSAPGAIPSASASAGHRVVPAALSATTGLETPWLHVQQRSGQLAAIVDDQNRQVLLRGANSEGMEDQGRRSGANPTGFAYPLDAASYNGACPANNNEVAPPLCEQDAALGVAPLDRSAAFDSHNDFAQMRADGFNAVRLPISWSQLEPTPGVYGGAYLDHIAQIVGWAKSQGIYVLLDMHQDGYSRFLQPDPSKPCGSGTTPAGGFDGAPAWAVLTDGKAACAALGQSVLNPALLAAFDHFWRNDPAPVAQGAAPGPGLQDHYIGAMASVARRFVNEPAVMGYELMNEPQPGSFNAFVLARDYAYPFYRRAIEALTGERDGLSPCPSATPSGTVPLPVGSAACAYPDLGVHDHHLMLAEPVALRNLTDFSPEDVGQWSHYPNLVLAPHTYTHVFTVDQFIGYNATNSPYPPTFDFAYATAAAQAERMNAAVLVTEFGTGTELDQVVTKPVIQQQERWAIGALEWTWKSNCSLDPAASCGGDGWTQWFPATPGPGPQPQNGPERAGRAALMRRVYPMRTAGVLGRYGYDVDTHAAVIGATASAGDVGRSTVVFVPAAASGTIAVSGSAVLTGVAARPDGNRVAVVTPTAAGAYQMAVGDPADVTAEAQVLASNPPLKTISLTDAEKAFFAFLDVATQSSDPHIAQQAALVKAIAKSILSEAPAPPPPSTTTTTTTTTMPGSGGPSSPPAVPIRSTPNFTG